jgi:hypothetical protein
MLIGFIVMMKKEIYEKNCSAPGGEEVPSGRPAKYGLAGLLQTHELTYSTEYVTG